MDILDFNNGYQLPDIELNHSMSEVERELEHWDLLQCSNDILNDVNTINRMYDYEKKIQRYVKDCT